MKKLFLIFCFAFLFTPAFAAPNDLTAVRAQIKTTEAQERAAAAKIKENEKNLAGTKRDLVRAAERLDKVEEDRAKIRANISSLDKQRARLLESLSDNRGYLTDAASGLITVSMTPPTFSTNDTHDYILSSVLLSGAADKFDSEMTSAQERIAALERVQKQKKSEQDRLAKTAKKYNAERADLDKLMKARTAQNERLRAQQFDLQRKLRDLSARAKNLEELTKNVSKNSRPRSDAAEQFSGRRIKTPVSGQLITRFGDKSKRGVVSDGWIIRTRGSALVTAPADGRVEFADAFRGNGHVVILSHKGGLYTVVTGLAQLDALVGQEVLSGEPIGRMPADGRDGARPEMYMELRKGSDAVNPARLFLEP